MFEIWPTLLHSPLYAKEPLFNYFTFYFSDSINFLYIKIYDPQEIHSILN